MGGVGVFERMGGHYRGLIGSVDRPPPFPHERYSVVVGSAELGVELADAGVGVGMESGAAP